MTLEPQRNLYKILYTALQVNSAHILFQEKPSLYEHSNRNITLISVKWQQYLVCGYTYTHRFLSINIKLDLKDRYHSDYENQDFLFACVTLR